MCTEKYISFCVFQPFNFHLIVCDYFLMRSWIPRPHLKLFSFFFSFSVSFSLQTVAASMQCDVMPRRILSFFCVFRLNSIEKRFRCVYFIFFRCLLMCSRLCWRNDAHKMRHTFSLCRCTHGGLFFIFFIFFPIINVMGFHCYCHSLAAVQLYLMIVIIGSRNSGRVDIFSQTNLRNVYHLTRKIKKTTNELNSGKMILFP